ncbi:hypothetical protein ABID21_000961 [Pseudorhizobium tarimense]|uniref:Transposase n=1 Tax=Pseudorhizobium tarimense TaxID=1079109 RepID=A0ABV2H2U6_9HYPH
MRNIGKELRGYRLLAYIGKAAERRTDGIIYSETRACKMTLCSMRTGERNLQQLEGEFSLELLPRIGRWLNSR